LTQDFVDSAISLSITQYLCCHSFLRLSGLFEWKRIILSFAYFCE